MYRPCLLAPLHRTHHFCSGLLLVILEPSTPIPTPAKTSKKITVATSRNVETRSPQIWLQIFVISICEGRFGSVCDMTGKSRWVRFSPMLSHVVGNSSCLPIYLVGASSCRRSLSSPDSYNNIGPWVIYDKSGSMRKSRSKKILRASKSCDKSFFQK